MAAIFKKSLHLMKLRNCNPRVRLEEGDDIRLKSCNEIFALFLYP